MQKTQKIQSSNMKITDIAPIIMFLGVTALLASFADFYSLLFPVSIKSSFWVYSVSQRVSDIIIMPILSITFILLGVAMSELRKYQKFNRNVKWVLGSLCLIYFLSLSLNIVLYSISINPVQNKQVEAVKAKSQQIKDKMAEVYAKYKNTIEKERYDVLVEKVDTDLIYQINQINTNNIKTNIKTLINLLLFDLLYLFAGIKILSLDKLLAKKLKTRKR
ncbi:MAG TPA: hypothetical protein P5556_08420 [Candidatus Gastranaerophilales bacterium]|nr:hypothetical protein [Candidatus Gastranaerophilales bacterium]